MKTIISILTMLLPFTVNIFSQNITNTLGTLGVFKIKDGSTDYLTLNQSTGQVNILKTLRLENTTSATTGVIFLGPQRFIHTYMDNTFMGINSGNFTMTGYFNTAVGLNSLYSNFSGFQNTSLGVNSLYSNTNGYNNTAVGYRSLYSNTTGALNIALGSYSLSSNTTGDYNTAVGLQSLFSNTTGYNNTAVGRQSMYSNTTGFYNTAVGLNSLYSNAAGIQNTSLGVNSLYSNTTGNYNTALGLSSLFSNTTGNYNTALGLSSLFSNTTGFQNTAVGYNSLFSNTINSGNTAVGWQSLYSSTGYQNTAVGHHSLNTNTTGNFNTAIGYNSGSTVTTGYNLTLVGIDANPSSPTAGDQITLGNQYVTSLRCNVTTITSLSDRRDKNNIEDLPLGLDFITKLKPRQFNWDRREWYEDGISDGSKIKSEPTAGFIAQELDSAQTDAGAEWLNLVLKDNPEKWEATPGNLLPVMVKAIQELNEKCESLQSENDALQQQLIEMKDVKDKLTKLSALIEEMKQTNKEIKLTEK